MERDSSDPEISGRIYSYRYLGRHRTLSFVYVPRPFVTIGKVFRAFRDYTEDVRERRRFDNEIDFLDRLQKGQRVNPCVSRD